MYVCMFVAYVDVIFSTYNDIAKWKYSNWFRDKWVLKQIKYS